MKRAIPERTRDELQRLPYPLGLLYGRAFDASDVRTRHDYVFAFLESFIKLAGSILSAAYLEEVRRGAVRDANVDQYLLELQRPSLGHWQGLLRCTAGFFRERPAHPLAALSIALLDERGDLKRVQALRKKLKANEPGGNASKFSILSVLDPLVTYRNEIAHGAPKPGDFYVAMTDELLLPAIDDLTTSGAVPLLGEADARLVWISEVGELGNGQVRLGVRDLNGVRSDVGEPLQIAQADAVGLTANQVALVWKGRPPLSLHPLLLFSEGWTCEELLLIDTVRKKGQVRYLGYASGQKRDEGSTFEAVLAIFTAASSGEPIELPEDLQADAEFELLGEIGRGGMGVVHLAWQKSLQRIVALKTLPPEALQDDVKIARFHREIRALARCEHPNIVRILASGTLASGELYYAMEYVPGCDLERLQARLAAKALTHDASSWSQTVLEASREQRDRVRLSSSDGRLAPRTSGAPRQTLEQLLPIPVTPDADAAPDDYRRHIVRIIRDAALAVQSVHDQHIIHRDIKPANLMLTAGSGRVMLMDFGLAKLTTQATFTRQRDFLGTRRYAAPEQFAAATLQVGPAADVRSLGVTLWELLSRRSLFAEAADEAQLGTLIFSKDVPRLRSIDPAIDRDLEAIVARAVERNVDDRIPSAARLAEYLDLYLQGKPVPVRTPTVGEMLWRWMLENAALASALSVAAMTVLATVIVAFIMITQALESERITSGQNKKLAVTEKKARDDADERAEDLKKERLRLSEQLSRTAYQRAVLAHERGQNASATALLAHAYQRLPADARPSSPIPYTAGMWMSESAPMTERFMPPASASYDPTGRKRIVRVPGNLFEIWDVLAGQPDVDFEGFPSGTTFACWPPANDCLLLGNLAGDLRAYRYPEMTPLGIGVQHRFPIGAVNFSPDEQLVLSVAERPVFNTLEPATFTSLVRVYDDARLWNWRTGKQVAQFEGPFEFWKFSPDGSLLLMLGDKRLTNKLDVFATASGERLPALVYEGEFFDAAFSSSGEEVTIASTDGQISTCRARTGERIHSFATQRRLSQMMLSVDGKLLITLGDEIDKEENPLLATASNEALVEFWDLATRSRREFPSLTFPGMFKEIQTSPDGRLLLIVNDRFEVRVVEIESGAIRFELPAPETRSPFPSFHPGGMDIYSHGGIWELGKKSLVLDARVRGSINHATFSPSGVALWHTSAISAGTPRKPPLTYILPLCDSLAYGEARPGTEMIRGFNVSPDGQWQVAIDALDKLYCWPATSEQMTVPPRELTVAPDKVPPDRKIARIEFGPGSSWMATWLEHESQGRRIALWQVPSLQPMAAAASALRQIDYLKFAPGGQRFVVITRADEAQVFRSDTLEPEGKPFTLNLTAEFIRAHGEPDRSPFAPPMNPDAPPPRHFECALTPDGRTLFLATDNWSVLHGMEGRRLMAWDTRTGQPTATSVRFVQAGAPLWISPDGKSLALVTYDPYTQGDLVVLDLPDLSERWKLPNEIEGSHQIDDLSNESLTLRREGLLQRLSLTNGKALTPPLVLGENPRPCLLPEVAVGLETQNSGDARWYDALSGEMFLRRLLGSSRYVDLDAPSYSLFDTWAVQRRVFHDRHLRWIARTDLPDSQLVLFEMPPRIPTAAFEHFALVWSSMSTSQSGEAEDASEEALAAAWESLRKEHRPWLAERAAFYDRVEARYHRAQASRAEASGNAFATEFHLRWLLKADPGNGELKRRYEAAKAKLPARR